MDDRKRKTKGRRHYAARVGGKALPPHSFCVYVGGRLRCWPARRALAWVIGLATRQGIAGIVEMHNRLQAFEISIMTVCLHEVRRGPFVNIAQCRHLKPRLILRRQRAPARIYRRRIAERVSLGEKSADTAIDE